jgi:GAF domain-containing protein
MEHDPVERALLAVTESVAGQDATVAAVDALTNHAVGWFRGAVGSGVSLLGRGGTISTVGATSLDVEAADRFQNELGDGPCVHSLREDEVVHVPDLASDGRWRRWAEPVVSRLGFHAVLAAPLYTNGRRIGSLNVYGPRPGAFSEHQVREIGPFARHTAMAVAAVQKAEQLRAALDSRTVIGQAEGIVMERYGVDAPTAFALLTRLSQHRNEKLRDVAASIVADGVLPAGSPDTLSDGAGATAPTDLEAAD